MDLLTSFWLPVGIWTLAVLAIRPLIGAVRSHPEIRVSLHSALLYSLPFGLLIPAFVPDAPSLMSGTAIEQWLIVVTADGAMAGGASAGTSWGMYDVWPVLTWAAGMFSVVGLIRLGMSAVALRRHRREGLTPAGEASQAVCDAVAEELGMAGRPRLMVAESGTIPHAIGFFKALVAVPEDLQDDIPAMRLVLLHELAHIRRGDTRWGLIEQITLALLWFHPLAHRLVRDLQRGREMACDAEVLTARPADARPYASILMRFADMDCRPELTLAIAMASHPKLLIERIQTMKSHRHPARFASIGAILVFALMSTGIALGRTSASQPPPPPPPVQPEPEVFIVVEKMPEPVGGMKAIFEAIRYPKEARDAGVEGRVVVQFTVDEQGNVTEPKVIRGIGSGCDEAAVAAITSVKFTPGMQRGRAVKVQFQLPIVFRLGDPGGDPA